LDQSVVKATRNTIQNGLACTAPIFLHVGYYLSALLRRICIFLAASFLLTLLKRFTQSQIHRILFMQFSANTFCSGIKRRQLPRSLRIHLLLHPAGAPHLLCFSTLVVNFVHHRQIANMSNNSPPPTPPSGPPSLEQRRFKRVRGPLEWIENYRPEGYHPIHLHDCFKNNRYEVIRKLGVGSFSTVWLAIDHK
jgi:hypothetical protein